MTAGVRSGRIRSAYHTLRERLRAGSETAKETDVS